MPMRYFKTRPQRRTLKEHANCLLELPCGSLDFRDKLKTIQITRLRLPGKNFENSSEWHQEYYTLRLIAGEGLHEFLLL